MSRYDVPASVIGAVRDIVRTRQQEEQLKTGRRELVVEVVARLRHHFPGWTGATWDRQVRKATEELRRGDPPLVNDGRGFYFAWTPEEVRDGTKRERRKAHTLLLSIAHAERSSVLRVAQQLELEFETEGSVGR